MKSKRTFSFKTFLIIFNSTIIILETLILFVLPSRLYSSLFTHQAENYCKDIVTQTSKGILSALNEFDLKIKLLIHDSSLLNLIDSPDSRNDEILRYKAIISNYFSPQSLESYYLQEVDLYVKDTETFFFYGNKPTNVSNPFTSKYFASALSTPSENNWIGYNSNSDCIEITRLIYDKISYKTLAFLVIRLSKDFLLDKFNAYNKIEIENMLIVNDGGGNILCANDEKLLGTNIDYSLLSSLNDDSGVIRSNDKLTVYCRFLTIDKVFPYGDWYTIIQLNKKTLLHDFYLIFVRVNIIAIAIIFIEVIITLNLSRFLTEPVKKLVYAMQRVREGNLNYSFSIRTIINEFAIVENGFNEMVHQLDNLIKTVYESKIIQKEMQLKTLKSQINPHFLFNTLQLISWKARDYAADEISDMIYSLSCMLDTDLYTGDENTFTLREEIDYIHHYAKIIHYKYEDKIQIILDVPDELLCCRIPKLILQPFLENAVVHGLAQKATSGSVIIKVTKEANDLIVLIQDDGVGIRRQTLKMLQNGTAGTENICLKDSHHIALKNVQSRIKILYGNNYGFTIDSQLHNGTTITLKIPYIKEAENSDKSPDR